MRIRSQPARRGAQRYYPVCLDVRGCKCVVAGGGAVAERKVRSLMAAGARVWVVSPALTPGLALLARRERIVYRRAAFRGTCLSQAALVIAATGDGRVNARIARAARLRNIPVNVVDVPLLSSFIVPAVVRRGAITVSVSTNGISPFLARQIRRRLARFLGPEYAGYARLCGAARRRIREGYAPSRRKELYRRIGASPALALLRSGRRTEAEATVRRIIERGWRAH